MKALATAICKAQAQIEGAKKDSTNPHFKTKYADLASVWDACRDALTAHGLSVVQGGMFVADQWVLVTTLMHESGEAISHHVPLINGKGDMQGLGSALTYARRYGLAAMVGVSPEDDDGNAASQKTKPAAAPALEPVGYSDWRADFIASADDGLAAMVEVWAETAKPYQEHWAVSEPEAARKALKARAAAVTVA